MGELRQRWFGPDSGDRYRLALLVLLSLAGTPVVVYELFVHVDDLGAALALAAGALVLGVLAVVGRRVQQWMPAVAAAYLAMLVYFTGGGESHLSIAFLLTALASAFLHTSRWFALNLAIIVGLALLPWSYDPETTRVSGTEGDAVAGLMLLASVIVVHVLSEVLRARHHRLQVVLEEQRRSIAALREAQQVKDLFLSALSHELRTPLTSIMGISQTLQLHDERLLPSQREDMVERIVRNSQRLHRLLTDLLDLRRLQLGASDLALAPVHLQDLVDAALCDLELHGCTVHVDVPPVAVNVDASKVERILVNLVANACKHTPPDSNVWVRATVDEHRLQLVVEDDGEGVPDHLKLSVFETFQQGPSSHVDPSPGTGVGLSIVDQFARLHGGHAWVEDRVGGGAAFHVDLTAHGSRRTRRSTSRLSRSLHADERR